MTHSLTSSQHAAATSRSQQLPPQSPPQLLARKVSVIAIPALGWQLLIKGTQSRLSSIDAQLIPQQHKIKTLRSAESELNNKLVALSSVLETFDRVNQLSEKKTALLKASIDASKSNLVLDPTELKETLISHAKANQVKAGQILTHRLDPNSNTEEITRLIAEKRGQLEELRKELHTATSASEVFDKGKVSLLKVMEVAEKLQSESYQFTNSPQLSNQVMPPEGWEILLEGIHSTELSVEARLAPQQDKIKRLKATQSPLQDEIGKLESLLQIIDQFNALEIKKLALESASLSDLNLDPTELLEVLTSHAEANTERTKQFLALKLSPDSEGAKIRQLIDEKNRQHQEIDKELRAITSADKAFDKEKASLREIREAAAKIQEGSYQIHVKAPLPPLSISPSSSQIASQRVVSPPTDVSKKLVGAHANGGPASSSSSSSSRPAPLILAKSLSVSSSTISSVTLVQRTADSTPMDSAGSARTPMTWESAGSKLSPSLTSSTSAPAGFSPSYGLSQNAGSKRKEFEISPRSNGGGAAAAASSSSPSGISARALSPASAFKKARVGGLDHYSPWQSKLDEEPDYPGDAVFLASPIHSAIVSPNELSAIRLEQILSEEDDLSKSISGWNPLLLLIRRGDVKLIIEYLNTVNTKLISTPEGWDALSLIAYYSKLDSPEIAQIIQKLIAKGADINGNSGAGTLKSPLNIAAWNNRFHQFNAFLNSNGSFLTPDNKTKMATIHCVTLSGHNNMGMLAKLLARYSNLSGSKQDQQKKIGTTILPIKATAFMFAALHGWLKGVQALAPSMAESGLDNLVDFQNNNVINYAKGEAIQLRNGQIGAKLDENREEVLNYLESEGIEAPKRQDK